jgi:malate dehydrogenase (oxaloacetate-decarboxylating)(NADP+)
MGQRDEAGSMLCGSRGQYNRHLGYIENVLSSDVLHPTGALSLMIQEDGPLFIADTQVHMEPTPEEIAETAISAARHVRRFGIEPNVAFCAQSQFGNQDCATGTNLRAAMAILDAQRADFPYEGEMSIDSALDPDLRRRIFPENRMTGAANVLVFAHADAAGGVRSILRMKGGGLEVGPILMGMGNRAHIVTPAITARGILNMAAIAGTPVSNYA